MRIKSLEMRAKVVVEGFLTGLHRSPYHGFSVEFSEYRQYSPGDDLRYFDWRLYARTDRHYIKKFEEETNLRCTILLDFSRSMAFGEEYSKADYGRTLAATIAYFLISQRDAVGLATFDNQLREVIPPRFRTGQLHRLLSSLEREPGDETDLAEPLEQVAQVVRKRSLIILISDLLAPLEGVERSLRQLRSHGHEVIVFRTLDRAEREFDFRQPTMFFDMETGKNIYVDPDAARADYLERFESHHASIVSICGSLGADFEEVITDTPLESLLFDFLNARLRRGRQVMRRGGFGGGSG
jgi:uncharacterized protein (DUF58 family)